MFKKLGDFFLDKNNSGDEKRFFGIVFLISALVYAFSGKPDNAILLTLVGTGTALLGIASAADGIK